MRWVSCRSFKQLRRALSSRKKSARASAAVVAMIAAVVPVAAVVALVAAAVVAVPVAAVVALVAAAVVAVPVAAREHAVRRSDDYVDAQARQVPQAAARSHKGDGSAWQLGRFRRLRADGP